MGGRKTMLNFIQVAAMPKQPERNASQQGSRRRSVWGLILVVAMILGVVLARPYLNVDWLIEQESFLRSWRARNGVLAVVAACLIYAITAGLSIPIALPMTLVCGWLFGFWIALPIVSVGSTAGATAAFLFGRFFLKDWVRERLERSFRSTLDRFDNDGPYYLFSLRLIPIMPYSVVNLGMSLSSIRWYTFWWISQLGMLPATIAYVYAGAALPNIDAVKKDGVSSILNPRIVIALVVIGILPLLAKYFFRSISKTQPNK